MKKILPLVLCALAVCSLNSCFLKFGGGGKKEALQESVWNAEGVWKRHSSDPKLFVPSGYRGAVNVESGAFVQDKRDGKRLFVPKGGANGYPEAVLRNDAYKSTGAKR